jgi:hypothetical protein
MRASQYISPPLIEAKSFVEMDDSVAGWTFRVNQARSGGIDDLISALISALTHAP